MRSLSFLIVCVLAACGNSKPEAVQQPAAVVAAPVPERSLGPVGAPVQLVEYPTIEKDFIATGKVRYTYKDFPLDGLALKAALLSRCLPEAAYFPFIKRLYAERTSWIQASGDEAALKKMAEEDGLKGPALSQCLANKALMQGISLSAERAQKELGVESTPSFFINGQRYTGAFDPASLSKALEVAAGAQPK
jgi:protein-disulfide isomerase